MTWDLAKISITLFSAMHKFKNWTSAAKKNHSFKSITIFAWRYKILNSRKQRPRMFMDQSALNFFYLTFKGTFSYEIGCLSEIRFFWHGNALGNIFILISVHGGYSEWSQWSVYHYPCGRSYSMRKRKCDNPVAKYRGDPCPPHEGIQSNWYNLIECPRKWKFYWVSCQWKVLRCLKVKESIYRKPYIPILPYLPTY